MNPSGRSMRSVRADVTETPLWFDPLSPCGSAVKYLASLSPRFHWVGIYFLKGKFLKLGPYIGKPTEHKKIAVGQGVCGTAVATGQDQNVGDVREVKNYLSCSLETRSELVVLIKNKKGKVVAQIDIDSHEPDAFGSQEQTWVKDVANALGELWNERKMLSKH